MTEPLRGTPHESVILVTDAQAGLVMLGSMHLVAAVVVSLASSLATLFLMQWARGAYQIRTLPERLMEWSLLFMSSEQFEAGIARFGTSAKTLALGGFTIGTVAVLLGLGVVAVRAGVTAILLTSAGLWLFAMAVVMPLTGGGFFGSSLLADVPLTNVSYLTLAAVYGATLLLGRWLALGLNAPAPSGSVARTAAGSLAMARRAFLGTGLGALGGLAATAMLGRNAGSVASDLPLATIDSLPIATATPEARGAVPTATGTAPTATAASASATVPSPTAVSLAAAPPTTAPTIAAKPAVATATAAPAAAAKPAPAPTQPPASKPTVAPAAPAPPTATSAPAAPPPTPAPLPPNPTPKRQLKRDDDGSLTASGRKAGELAKLITPIPDFYITTKNAGGDPIVDGARWRMVLDGEMNRPVQVDLRTIRALPSVTVAKTLECISNRVTRCEEAPFGCDLISTAEWRGARFADVLALAGGLKANVRSFAIIGADEYSASIPANSGVIADLVLAYEMNGETLPLEHGYPLRLIIPDRYGYKNAKWVVGIRAMTGGHVDWYGARGWSADGIVKTMSRIDVPANGAQLPPGEHRAAGIAYAGARGIRTIEFSADGGATWAPARLVEPPIGRDVWTRWESTFTLRPGQPIELTVRAIDGAGQRQNEQYSLVPPDGQSGRHAITVAPA